MTYNNKTKTNSENIIKRNNFDLICQINNILDLKMYIFKLKNVYF